MSSAHFVSSVYCSRESHSRREVVRDTAGREKVSRLQNYSRRQNILRGTEARDEPA